MLAKAAPTRPSAEEQFFFQAANRERAARGLPAYQWDETLAVAARKHASLMAKEKELSHQLRGEAPLDERVAQAGGRFSSVGENIAIGTDTPGIQMGWMESPGHRANILDAHFTALGVGVVAFKDEFYAVQDFSVAVADLTRVQQEEKVAEMLKSRGVHVLDDRSEARRSCTKGYIPAHRTSVSILRLETPDLNSISEDLERNLRSKRFRQAEVGACPPAKAENNILRFRVVILLFPDVGGAISN